MHALHCFHHILHAMHSALRRLDLNLLLTFEALFRHRSVVAAADELAISPSACSHALARLREGLGDELFFRAGSSMQPTPRATEMAEGISQALHALSDQLGNQAAFVPSSSTQFFTFAATDFTTFALIPALISRIEHKAPHVRLRVVHSRHRGAYSALVQEGAHFVMGFSDEFSPVQEGVEVLQGNADTYVVVARRGHPRIGKKLSMEQYLAERHVVVKPWQEEAGVIDSALSIGGWAREVAIEVPSVMAAPFIVANSDLLITLPRLAAHQLEASAAITIFDAPFEVPSYNLNVYFQRRHLSSPWHRWMRDQIESVLHSKRC